MGHFGFWVTLGHVGSFLGHFVAYLDKFAESSNFFAAPLGSWGLLLECMRTFDNLSGQFAKAYCHPPVAILSGIIYILY